ncbi:hypothetical protein [Ammoniphilus resinae]|uniref:Uncharacterized protein n=1 Tax=Ammoniphilus resinae TaxID=861532 RepID=A0ABS4GL64_9BACL|nr:hypothetical protein [Ammoniphilus resinae]MBP1931010.1 hypothetical protein [Ammoniphilus resinae]
MANKTWIKWAVGLAGVTSFGAFVGALNQENGVMLAPAANANQAFDQTYDSDPVQEEWMNDWNYEDDDHNGDEDEYYEDDDYDEYEDNHHEKKNYDRQKRVFAQSQTSGRTRAS